jgi:hypothetical protein
LDTIPNSTLGTVTQSICARFNSRQSREAANTAIYQVQDAGSALVRRHRRRAVVAVRTRCAAQSSGMWYLATPKVWPPRRVRRRDGSGRRTGRAGPSTSACGRLCGVALWLALEIGLSHLLTPGAAIAPSCCLPGCGRTRSLFADRRSVARAFTSAGDNVGLHRSAGRGPTR